MIKTLLPPSIAGDANIRALAEANEGIWQRLFQETVKTIILPRIDEIEDESLLDLLAWQFHLEGYEFARDITEKRFFIKNFFEFHRYKGTLYGIKLFIRYLLRRKLIKAETPHKSFIGRSLTEEERARFEALMPEIRIYSYRHGGKKKSLFCGDHIGDPSGFPAKTDAILRIGDLVELYDPLMKTAQPLNYFKIEKEWIDKKTSDIIEVRLKSKAHGIFLNLPLKGYTVNEEANKRFYTIQLERLYQEEYERRIPLSIQPSLLPVRSYYELEKEHGSRGYATFLANRYADIYPDRGGSYLQKTYTASTDANMRLYKKLKLFASDRAQLHIKHSTTFLGGVRLGKLPAHWAQLAIDMSDKKPPRGLHCAGFLCEHMYTSDAARRISRMRNIVKMSVRLSDKILVSIRNRKQVPARNTIKAGEIKTGEYKMEVI